MQNSLIRRALALILCLALLLPGTALLSRAETASGQVTKNSVHVRTGPGTNYATVKSGGSDIYLNAGHAVTVTGNMSAADGAGYRWYPVSFLYGSGSFSGYIREDLMTVSAPAQPVAPNGDYEAQRAAFPESYRPYLDALHAAHPSWNFEAFNTGFDWSYVQENENAYRRSMTQSTGEGYRSQAAGCYDASTGQYIVLEGGSWYQASPALVAYYMDPRNFLNDNDIFQFEKLSYNAQLQTAAGVASMLGGSFMANASITDLNGNAVSYADAFVTAGAVHNVSLYHLVARCIQEVGRSGNAVGTRGDYPGYEGIYNYFSIGANTGAVDGLKYAARTDEASYRPWNTPFKAIMGGAQFLSSGYISRGQDTLYLQKFNVTTTGSFYHQYMANIAAPNSEGHTTRKSYANLGLLETGFTFRIPVYNNMPAYPCGLPGAADGNTKLSALRVEGYELTPAFSPDEKNYALTLPENVDRINVIAAAASAPSSRVSGNVGDVTLQLDQVNVLNVVCTSASGNTQTYTIRVTAMSGASGWDPFLTVSGAFITDIAPGTTASQLIGDLNLYGRASAVVSDGAGNTVTGKVATGQLLRYYDGATTADYAVVIFGDVCPDGVIDTKDVTALRQILLEQLSPSGAVRMACDLDRDGDADAADLLLLYKSVKG